MRHNIHEDAWTSLLFPAVRMSSTQIGGRASEHRPWHEPAKSLLRRESMISSSLAELGWALQSCSSSASWQTLYGVVVNLSSFALEELLKLPAKLPALLAVALHRLLTSFEQPLKKRLTSGKRHAINSDTTCAAPASAQRLRSERRISHHRVGQTRPGPTVPSLSMPGKAK